MRPSKNIHLLGQDLWRIVQLVFFLMLSLKVHATQFGIAQQIKIILLTLKLL